MDHLIDDADRELELPPEGHPLHKLGARLTELLDEDQWAACERLLLEGWAHDAIAREAAVIRKDAERYRWRKENPAIEVEVFRGRYRCTARDSVVTDWLDSYDEAIDAAMQGANA